MSRTFKRPMFRKGGNVGTGIMSGVVDRSMHANDPFVGDTDQFPNLDTRFNVLDTSENISPEVDFVDKKLDYTPTVFEGSDLSVGEPKSLEAHIAEVRKGAGSYGGMDPLTTFLLSAGPRVAGATSISDAIQKLDVPAEKLMKLASDKANWERGIRLKGLERAQAHDEKLDERRWQKLNKADDRNWQQFLTQDERTYLQSVSQLDFYRQKGLIRDERKFSLDILKDKRAYEKLGVEDQRDWEERVNKRARDYAKLDREEQQDFQREMIEAGNAFELEQIIRREKHDIKMQGEQFKQKKQLIDIQTKANLAAANQYTGKDFFQDYENTTHANNRALYENKVREEMNQTFGHENNGGIVFSAEGTGNENWQEKKGKKKNIGKVFFNLNDGKHYKFDYGLDPNGNKVLGWTIIDDLKTYEQPEPINQGEVVKTNLLGQTTLTRENAQKIADERDYILIGKAPNIKKQSQWIAEQKKLLGDKAKTLHEIQSIIRKEQRDKEREGLNRKGHRKN